jgi:hypothetical protein
VKTGNSSACAAVNWKLCKPAVGAVLPVCKCD